MVYVGLLDQRLIDEKQVVGQALLPPVVPVVLYNGARQWSAPLEVAHRIAGGPGDLNRYRPRWRYFLLKNRPGRMRSLRDAEVGG